MKLEIGKVYRAHDGTKVHVYKRGPYARHPFVGRWQGLNVNYTEYGHSKTAPSPRSYLVATDIVAEWEEEPDAPERISRLEQALAVLTDPQAKAFVRELAWRYPDASLCWDAEDHEVEFIHDSWAIIVFDGGAWPKGGRQP